MKNIIKGLTLILCLSTLSSFGQSREQQNALVEKVLDNMVNSTTMSVSSFISPAYLKAHKVSASSYQINTYSPVGFSIDENKGNGVVVARIWGSSRGWVHRLTFIVTYEDGSYYFMPGREPSTYMYIDPWYKVETDITDDDGGGTGGTVPTATESRKIVTDLLYDMVNDADNFGTGARKYIAPSYYKKNNIDKYDYQINYYSPSGSEIKTVGNDGMVIALIWGSGKSWINKLTFKVVKEGGKVYVYPKGHTDNFYIHPWYEVEIDAVDKPEVEKNDKTELVEKICYAMVYEKETFDKDMRLYIAPSYYKKYSIDPFVFLVNSYSPVGYSIESVDSKGIVKAKIWGEDRGWVHELTFKVVEESGLLYVMPGKHYPETEYVDPWFSVRTSITE
ncbi:MAG: hypothetical protein ACYC1Q_06305 [Bacteroidia bacterium]